jgi:hypothetical protein
LWQFKALPERAFSMPRNALSERVLAYLDQAKWEQINGNGMEWYDDYAIAYLTVLYAVENPSIFSPHVWATYSVLGLRPEQVWPAIIERRKAKLGVFYSRFYDAQGTWIPDPITISAGVSPRKPMQSVRIVPPRRERAA